MERIVYSGRIRGEFTGFDENRIFAMTNGTYWVQAHYKYWYHYAYHPEVVISEKNGSYFLTIAGRSIQVRKVHCVADAQIRGNFTGWDGHSRYELLNGQVWEQTNYKYQYCFSHQPSAVICDVGGRYVMQVCGTSAVVRRT